MHTQNWTSRVLVVDDEPLIRWSVSETLSDQGFQVVESGDAQAARNAVRDATRAFDVVVLDLNLPDSRDLSLLRLIHAMAPAAQVVLMTAYATPEVVQEAVEAGAFDVVNKPFEIEHLARVVGRAVAAGAERRVGFPH